MPNPKKPDFHVKAKHRTHAHMNGRVGAGWLNPDGSIAVRLDPFVVLQGSHNLVITLFPVEADTPTVIPEGS